MAVSDNMRAVRERYIPVFARVLDTFDEIGSLQGRMTDEVEEALLEAAERQLRLTLDTLTKARNSAYRTYR